MPRQGRYGGDVEISLAYEGASTRDTRECCSPVFQITEALTDS